MLVDDGEVASRPIADLRAGSSSSDGAAGSRAEEVLPAGSSDLTGLVVRTCQLGLALPIASLALAYGFAAAAGDLAYPYFHPSVALNHDDGGRIVGTLGMALAAPPLAAFALARAAVGGAAIAERTTRSSAAATASLTAAGGAARNDDDEIDAGGDDDEGRRRRRLCAYSVASAALTIVSMIGVAAVPFQFNAGLHYSIAGLFFAAATLDVALQLVIDARAAAAIAAAAAAAAPLGRADDRHTRRAVGALVVASCVSTLGAQTAQARLRALVSSAAAPRRVVLRSSPARRATPQSSRSRATGQ